MLHIGFHPGKTSLDMCTQVYIILCLAVVHSSAAMVHLMLFDYRSGIKHMLQCYSYICGSQLRKSNAESYCLENFRSRTRISTKFTGNYIFTVLIF
jgi:hypothetical protein